MVRIFVLIFVLLIVVTAAFSGYFLVNYKNGTTAMDNQNFIAAQRYFDKIPFTDTLFSDEYEYIQAGVLMEQGNYLDALLAFRELNTPVPVSVIDDLTEKVYKQAQSDYRKKEYDAAKAEFSEIEDYERSEDYLVLINRNLVPIRKLAPVNSDYEDIVNLIGFEDADEIILKRPSYFEKFLVGTWKTGNKSNYFKMEKDGQTSYNLPVSGYGYIRYDLDSGKYRLYNPASGYTDCFKFAIVDKDTVRVFCYQNNKNYTLYRE